MSIYPEKAKQQSAVTPAKAGAQSNSQLDPGLRRDDRAERSRASGTPHRFDKLSRCVAKTLWSKLRISLAFLENKVAKAWSYEVLMKQLEEAEALARDALRAIAAKLHVSAAPVRERMESARRECDAGRGVRAPVFKLFEEENTIPRHPPTGSADLPQTAARQVEGGPGIARRANRDDDSINASRLSRRTAALEDVLAHPGRHAARMARAMYRRAQEGEETRLIVRDDDGLLLDRINSAIAAHENLDDTNAARLHAQVIEAG